MKDAQLSNPTHTIRPGKARSGTEHRYVLNGATLLDRLIDGRWVTVKVS
ncbi:hypothetical protein [Paraburkholderia sp. J8-2]|nr:hypothetical protein [Paraburkholderia sp. J8-2]